MNEVTYATLGKVTAIAGAAAAVSAVLEAEQRRTGADIKPLLDEVARQYGLTVSLGTRST